MAQLQDRLLQYVSSKDQVDTLTAAEELKEDHQKVIGAVKSLQSVGGIIEAEQLFQIKTELTEEGKSFVEKGSHEAILFQAVPRGKEGISQVDLMNVTGAAGKIGMSKAVKNGWVKLIKEGGKTMVVQQVENIVDEVTLKLQALSCGKDSTNLPSAAELTELKKRKLLTQVQVAYYILKKGPNFTLSIQKLETELTPEMLASGSWKEKKFKAYNFQALGTSLNSGHLHPLLKVRTEFRSILLEMGFSEMPTNRFVESSFWNFDALYVPQKHPARDAQDTFFMSQPEKCTSIPKDYMKRVQAAHTGQDFDTLGYGPVWKIEESYKNCMRTHTTAVSARMLHAIGSQSEFKPAKLFSIDRVFRNETLDATHLAEFHQVEGVVADYNINLGNLIGIMKEFFSRLGITKLRFKPAYNPYTEPSMEVFSYHEGLKKWVEVGNSGMFRPEMLLPMGIPKDVRIIAWGLSLERPTMIRYGIDNIRDLVGPKVDLQMVYNNPICRLDTANFAIGTDGSYLDTPLMKSPKKEKAKEPILVAAPVSPIKSTDDVVATKSKSKKKKKKKQSEKESVDLNKDENLSINPVETQSAKNDQCSGLDKSQIASLDPAKPVVDSKKKESRAIISEQASSSVTEALASISVATGDNNSQQQNIESSPQDQSTTKKSSKKKKKSKVKPAT